MKIRLRTVSRVVVVTLAVVFDEVDGETRVRLVHRGWEALGERAARARADYEGGWVTVLEKYAAAFEAAPARG